MKLKLLSLTLLIFMILGAVCASENISYFNESKNITFQDVRFTIPEGFGESRDAEDYDDLGSTGRTCFYINEYQGEIVITVISDWMGMSLEELQKDNSTKSSINGHEGWNYTEDGLHYFAYIHDNMAVLVGVTNETRLYEVII